MKSMLPSRAQPARRLTRSALLALLAGAALLLDGCASVTVPNPADPLEPLNRQVFRFNESVDAMLVKPMASAYKSVTPRPVRLGVRHFFANLGDGWASINSLLQAKPKDAIDSFFRLMVNTTMGLGGVLDVASELGIERHKEDLGQTLGRWGLPPGPFLMLPVLGPSTLRDTAALPLDAKGNLLGQIDPVRARNALTVTRAVGTRADLLEVDQLLDTAALDRYSFVRDAYLQKRLNDVHDGNPPEPVYDDEPDALPQPPAANSPAAPAQDGGNSLPP